MGIVTILALAAQLATGPQPDTPAEAALSDALRTGLSLQFVTCQAPAAKARRSVAEARLESLEPRLVAQLGRERIGGLLAGVIANPANIHTPGCPPGDELDRRVTGFEEAVGRLEAALGAAR